MTLKKNIQYWYKVSILLYHFISYFFLLFLFRKKKNSRLEVKNNTQHFNFGDRKAKHRQLTIKNHPSLTCI